MGINFPRQRVPAGNKLVHRLGADKIGRLVRWVTETSPPMTIGINHLATMINAYNSIYLLERNNLSF
jgi:hypothetical protein